MCFGRYEADFNRSFRDVRDTSGGAGPQPQLGNDRRPNRNEMLSTISSDLRQVFLLLYYEL